MNIERSFELLDQATRAFTRGQEALRRGDVATFEVCRLEHSMIAAVHRALFNPKSLMGDKTQGEMQE